MFKDLRDDALINTLQLIKVPSLAVPVTFLFDSFFARFVCSFLLGTGFCTLGTKLGEDIDGLIVVVVVVVITGG